METERNPFKIPLVLRTIFGHTSFSNLLQFRLVNSAWNFDTTFVARKISSGKDSSVSPITFRRHCVDECQFYTKHFDKAFSISEDMDTKLDEFNDCLRNSSNSFSFPSTSFHFFSLDLKIKDLTDFIRIFGAQVQKLEIDSKDFDGRDRSSFFSEADFVECLVTDFPNLKHLILGSFAFRVFPSSYTEMTEEQKKKTMMKFSHENLSSIKLTLNHVEALTSSGHYLCVNTKLIQLLLDSAVNLQEFINFEVELLPAFLTGTRKNIQRKLDTIKQFRMIKFQLVEMDDWESKQGILTFLKQLREFTETAPSLKKLVIFNVQKKPSLFPFPDDENDPFENANEDENENGLSFDESSTAKFESCLSLLLNSSQNSLEEISFHPFVCQRPLHHIFPQNLLKNVKTVKIYDFFQWFHLTGKKSSNSNEDQKQGFLLGPDFGHFLTPFFPNIQKFVIDLGNQNRSFKKFQFQLMDLKFSLPRSIRHLEIVSKRTGRGIGRFLQEIQDAILRQNSNSDSSDRTNILIERLSLKFVLFNVDFTEILQSIFEGAAWRNLTNLELGIVEDFQGTRYSNFDYDDGGFLDCEDEVDLNAAVGGILPRPTSTWSYPLPEEFCSPSSLCGISDENEFQSQVEKLKEKKLRGSIDQLSKLRQLSIDLGNDHSKLVKLNFVGIFLACESLPNLSVKVNVAQKNLEEMQENIFGQIQSARFNSRVFVTSGEKMENLERNPRTCHNDPNFYYC